MARLLVPADYGQLSIISIFIVISDIFVNGGFSNALIRKKNPTKDDYSTVFYFNIVIAIICYLTLWCSAPYIARFFNIPLIKELLRVQSICVIINSLLAVQMAKLSIDLNFKAIAKCTLRANIFSGILGIILAYVGFGVWALVCQSIFSCIVNLLSVSIASKWKPELKFSIVSFREMFSYGSKLLLSNIINKIYQNLSTFIIGKFYSSKDLGLYDRGAGLASFTPDTINGILCKVTFPILAKIQDEEERLMITYRKFTRMMSLIIFFPCIFIAAIAKPLIFVLLGTKWLGAAIFLQIFTFACCFRHIDELNLNLLYVKRRSDLVLKLEFIKKILSTIVLLVAVPFGVTAICFACVIHSQITFASDSYYTGKYYNYGFFKQIKDIAPYFICSILSSLPIYLITFSRINSILTLLIGGISAPTIFYFLLRHNESMIELREIIISKLRKNPVN